MAPRELFTVAVHQGSQRQTLQGPQTLSSPSSQTYPTQRPVSSYAPVATLSYSGNPLQDSQEKPPLEARTSQVTNVPPPTATNSNLPSHASPATDTNMQQGNFDPNYNPNVTQPAPSYSYVGQQQPQPQAYGQPNMPSPPQMQQSMSTMQTQPLSMQPVQTMQPAAASGMDIRNVKGIPRDGNGERDWSHGCSECFDDCGTCMLGWCCPCMLYSQIQTRLNHLETRGVPHPDGGDSCASDCFIHGLLTCCGSLGWVLQIGQRTAVRSRYRIAGDGCSDCMMAYCCSPCEMTQVSRELDLEERSFMGAAVMQAPPPQMGMNPNPNQFSEKR